MRRCQCCPLGSKHPAKMRHSPWPMRRVGHKMIVAPQPAVKPPAVSYRMWFVLRCSLQLYIISLTMSHIPNFVRVKWLDTLSISFHDISWLAGSHMLWLLYDSVIRLWFPNLQRLPGLLERGATHVLERLAASHHQRGHPDPGCPACCARRWQRGRGETHRERGTRWCCHPSDHWYPMACGAYFELGIWLRRCRKRCWCAKKSRWSRATVGWDDERTTGSSNGWEEYPTSTAGVECQGVFQSKSARCTGRGMSVEHGVCLEME